MEGAEKFLNNGATIPEIMNRSQLNSRALLAPQTKLLTEPQDNANAVEVIDVEPLEEPPVSPLSGSERAELLRLMEKLKKSDETFPDKGHEADESGGDEKG
jgi:hypothetical protein